MFLSFKKINHFLHVRSFMRLTLHAKSNHMIACFLGWKKDYCLKDEQQIIKYNKPIWINLYAHLPSHVIKKNLYEGIKYNTVDFPFDLLQSMV